MCERSSLLLRKNTKILHYILFFRIFANENELQYFSIKQSDENKDICDGSDDVGAVLECSGTGIRTVL